MATSGNGEMVVREVRPARQSASLGKCLLVDDDSPGIQMPNAANTVELCEALGVAIAELDAGLGVETTPDELMAKSPLSWASTNNERRVFAAQRIRR